MVLPVSGFLPVPLPMMIPFMGAQSLVIGKMFGEGFQYGKRKISAMPNEEFNKLTFEQMMSNAREEIKASIPTMNAAMQDMQPMVEVVVREFFNYVSLVTKIVSGRGEGENIFQQEGHDIGDWIKEQLGIPHTPHGATIPVTPTLPAGGPIPTPTQPFIGPPKPPAPRVDKCQGLWNIWQQRNDRLTWLTVEIRRLRTRQLQTTGRQNNLISGQRAGFMDEQRKLAVVHNAALNNPNNKDCAARWKIK